MHNVNYGYIPLVVEEIAAKLNESSAAASGQMLVDRQKAHIALLEAYRAGKRDGEAGKEVPLRQTLPELWWKQPSWNDAPVKGELFSVNRFLSDGCVEKIESAIIQELSR